MIALLLLPLTLAVPSVCAEEPAPAVVDDDDDFFTEKPAEDKGANAGVPTGEAFGEEEGFDIPKAPPPEAKVTVKDPEKELGSAAGSTAMPVNTAGAKILSDNWAPSIVVADKDLVVVDMPVLYATSKKDFDGTTYWLVAEVYADGKKVAESRVQVTRDAVADKAPSVQFFRLTTPVAAATGVLEVKVSKTPQGGKSELLFTRSVKYTVTA